VKNGTHDALHYVPMHLMHPHALDNTRAKLVEVYPGLLRVNRGCVMCLFFCLLLFLLAFDGFDGALDEFVGRHGGGPVDVRLQMPFRGDVLAEHVRV
jgi:hypothetical protein